MYCSYSNVHISKDVNFYGTLRKILAKPKFAPMLKYILCINFQKIVLRSTELIGFLIALQYKILICAKKKVVASI